jgi:hypothetical protein
MVAGVSEERIAPFSFTLTQQRPEDLNQCFKCSETLKN